MTDLEALARRIGGARRLTIMTGAGVSAASGVPTFRGDNGLWKQFPVEDLATPGAFARNPGTVWEWYAWRRERIAACRPNPAHEVIAAWSRARQGCTVITQNVDDLHVRADTQRLVRLHGSIWELRCAARCAAGARAWRDERVPLPEVPPRCPHCDALARPAVVWFGEALGAADVRQAVDAAACDVFLAVGTSAVVYPAAGFLHQAQSAGAFTVEINREPTPASPLVDVAVQGGAEEVLPEVDRRLRAG